MTGLKLACALLLTSALASPVWAAPGDAGSGTTMGATSTNDSGSGPTPGAAALKGQSSTTNSQSSTNGQTASGDAGSGPTMGATSTNDAGSGPTPGAAALKGQSSTTNSQSSMNGQTGTNGQTGINNQTGTSGQSGMNGQTGMNGGQNAMNAGPGMKISERLRNDLGKAGFTDVKIMPQSFLVQAKDSQGNQVVMMINPNSVTALTEGTLGANSASNASHGRSNNAGATPGPGSTGGAQPVTPGGATKP